MSARPLPHEIHPRPPALGLVVLQADETIEADMRRLLPPVDEGGADLLVTRVPSGREVTRETLAAMEGEITAACRLFPAGRPLAAVGYGCTSGTAVIGAERVAALVRAGVEAAHVTEPVSALVARCRERGVRRLAFVSPYTEPVSRALRAVLEGHGLEIARFASFDVAEEARVARIDTASVIAAARSVVADGRDGAVDAVFLSCTNLRTLPAIAALDLGVPVWSSNTVLAWHLGRLSGARLSDAAPSDAVRGLAPTVS